VLPKPLMPVGDRPILELLLLQLRERGVTDATIAVGHLAWLIAAYFGNGERLGISITYSVEEEPLGTAGPLGLITGLNETFLVMNGDLLTDVDFGAMIRLHRRERAAATIGIYHRDVPLHLGVIEMNDADQVTGYIEKPTYRYPVSMGVYAFEPCVLRHLPRGQRCDLPNLIRTLVGAGEKVIGYRHTGYWLDIGRPDDYQRAQEDFPVMEKRLLGKTDAEAGAAEG
jgi:NDP-sugar pyrophosphorylase family protein